MQVHPILFTVFLINLPKAREEREREREREREARRLKHRLPLPRVSLSLLSFLSFRYTTITRANTMETASFSKLSEIYNALVNIPIFLFSNLWRDHNRSFVASNSELNCNKILYISLSNCISLQYAVSEPLTLIGSYTYRIERCI